MKKSLILSTGRNFIVGLFFIIFSLNIGFVSNVLSMKRKYPGTLRSGKKKKLEIKDIKTKEGNKRKKVSKKKKCWLALKEDIRSIVGPQRYREINGYSTQLGAKRIYDLIDNRFNGNKNNDDYIVTDALVSYGYSVLEKIVNYLEIDPNFNLEFKKDAQEFIKRWKKFFENDYIYDCLFKYDELYLASKLEINWGPLYILQPLKKHTRMIKDINGKISVSQFEVLKKIFLDGIIYIVSIYFPIKHLCLTGNNLKHVSWYIFKLKYLEEIQNNLLQDLGDDYAREIKEKYIAERREFLTRFNNIFQVNRNEGSSDMDDEFYDSDDEDLEEVFNDEYFYNRYWLD